MPPDLALRRLHERQGRRTGPGDAEPIVIDTDEDEEDEEEEDSDDDSTDEHIDGNSSANQMRTNTTRTTGAASTTSRHRENRQLTTSIIPTIDLSSSFSSSPRPRIPESAITDDNFLRFPQVGFSAAIGAEKHKLSRLREVRSAAEAVMLNREILTIHAIAAHEASVFPFFLSFFLLTTYSQVKS
jgi:hypothetical protein